MSKQTTSLGVQAPRTGTLVACALEMDTRQLVLEASRQQAVALPCGIRNARFHFAASHPGVLYQPPIPHR